MQAKNMGIRSLTLVFWLICINLLASKAHGEILTLQKAIDLAKQKSPDIQNLSAQTESAHAKADQSLAPSEPTLGLTYQDMETPVHGLGEPASRVFTFTQPFAFPGKAFLSHSALDNQAQALGAQTHAMELTVALNVRNAYYQLALARENLRLNDEQHLFYQRIFAIAKRRYEGGAITQVDLLNAEIALHANENDLADLQSSEHGALAQLNLLIGNSVDVSLEIEPLKVEKRPPLILGDLEARMVDGRQELKAAHLQQRAAEQTLHLADASWLPDFQFTAGTTFYDAYGASPLSTKYNNVGGNHTYFAGLQLTVPIWFAFDQREAIRGARSDLRASKANSQLVLLQSHQALASAVDAIRTNETKIANFESHILPLADQSLNLAIVNYGAGKIDFQTLADTATARRVYRQSYLTTVISYYTAYSTLGQLIGEEL